MLLWEKFCYHYNSVKLRSKELEPLSLSNGNHSQFCNCVAVYLQSTILMIKTAVREGEGANLGTKLPHI